MIKKIIILSFVLGLIILGIINYRTPFFTQQKAGWSIGFNNFSDLEGVSKVSKENIYSLEKLKKVVDSTTFLADPFFIKEKGKYFMFFEHQKTRKGAVIGLMTSEDGIKYDYEGTVLQQDFHLSYPQVFKYKNVFYMLPESQGANNVLLYKAHNFPYDWRVCDTLLKNIKLKDPTIFLSDTLNILVGSDKNMTLFMYNADDLLGEWKLNQKAIVMKGTEARCGGRFIADGRDLLLPIQNSTKGYGYGLSIYRFSFTGTEYCVKKEKHLLLKANQDIKEFQGGMHHLDFQKTIEGQYYAVYDGNCIDEKKEYNLNVRGPLKWNIVDLMNWLEN